MLYRYMTFAAAVALLAATATSAQTQQAEAAMPAATAAVAATSRLSEQDATFLERAVEGDRLEIASAQTALQLGQRSDTQAAARTILEDHQRSSAQLGELASRKGWALPAAPAAAESDEARAVASAGSGFDEKFMAEQIRMHRDAISLYRAQEAGGSDPDLRQFARDTLPHLEHHLEMLQGANTQK